MRPDVGLLTGREHRLSANICLLALQVPW